MLPTERLRYSVGDDPDAGVRYGGGVSDPMSKLMAALAREDEDGNRVIPLSDVRHALPLIVLTAGLDFDSLSEGMQELMLETALEAGLDPEADPPATAEETVEAFAAYYREEPVSPDVLEEIRKAFAGDEDGPSKAAQALLGAPVRSGVLGGGERPAGTIPASLSRLQGFKKPS